MVKLNKKGFTLAELLIVVAVIAVLVAVAIPTFAGQLEKSRQGVDSSNLRGAYAAAKLAEIDQAVDGKEITTENLVFWYDADTSALYKDIGSAQTSLQAEGSKVVADTSNLPTAIKYDVPASTVTKTQRAGYKIRVSFAKDEVDGRYKLAPGSIIFAKSDTAAFQTTFTSGSGVVTDNATILLSRTGTGDVKLDSLETEKKTVTLTFDGPLGSNAKYVDLFTNSSKEITLEEQGGMAYFAAGTLKLTLADTGNTATLAGTLSEAGLKYAPEGTQIKLKFTLTPTDAYKAVAGDTAAQDGYITVVLNDAPRAA